MVGRVIPIRCCVCVFECGSVRAFVNVDGVREHVLGIVMKYRRTNCELFSMVILEKKLFFTSNMKFGQPRSRTLPFYTEG